VVSPKVVRALLPSVAVLGALITASPVAADVDAAKVAKALGVTKAGAPARHPFAEPDGRVPVLVRLPAGVAARDLGLLDVAPGMGAAHLTGERLKAFRLAHPDLTPVTAPPRHPWLEVSNIWTGARYFRQETGLDGTGVVIGIVDTGIDGTHPDFRDADGTTRIAWLMQRQEPVGLHPELEQQYGCTDPDQSPCAIFSSTDIDTQLLLAPDGAPRDFDGHGTHVTSIAAGNGGIMNGGNARYAGVAPGSTIIVTAPSGGGGFSDPDIINAARFIFERAEALGMPAVVNVSLGSDFGPHDGTSALEQGLAALVGEAFPGRVMTVAAGNSGTLYNLENDEGPFGIHTEAHVSPNAVTRVTMQQPGAAGTVDGSGFVWVNFRPGDEVSVGLEGPNGTWVPLTDPGNDRGHDWNYDGFSGTAGVVNNVADDRTQLTAQTNGAVVFWEGTWRGDDGHFAVTLRGRGDAQLWVTGLGGAGAGSGTLGLVFERALKAGTISVPASHPALIAVGCSLNRFRWEPLGYGSAIELTSFGGVDPVADSVCYFSAAGPTPTGAMKPDILAPGGFVAGAMSRDVDPRFTAASIFRVAQCPDAQPCGLVDEAHALTSGTSMSAPFVAGSAALLLQRDPTLTQTQVLEILQAGARRPIGNVPYDFQQGPGALSLNGALLVLEEKLNGESPISNLTSWYTLSSPYLRPDLGWVVQATVELREPDGTIGWGVPASAVQVLLNGAELVDPVTRVRGGLFRFGIAAPQGSGGTVAEIDVRVRNVSLGARELPVGVDSWAASGGVEAVGACSHGGGRAPAHPGWLLAAAVYLLRRRRQNAG
jgi:subtilisin family serine protease